VLPLVLLLLSAGEAWAIEPGGASEYPVPNSPAVEPFCGAVANVVTTASRSADVHPSWTFAVDGLVFGTFNSQGGHRGETEFRSQNWLMGMGSRRLGPGTLTLTGMFTLEPLTAPGEGYSEIFQEGEAYQNLQITDHQHPHDFFMQLAGGWRVPLANRTFLTLAGGPKGEATLGPVAFMHRASAAENPTAPLSHHIFDSTHSSSGVVMARLDRGIVSIEGSVFRGREPDEHRYDLEFGALDSWATRLWLRPPGGWSIQASYGFLHEPEQLEPGDQRRANASVSWFRLRGSDYTAFTAAFGRNERQYSLVGSVLAEGTHHVGRTSVYGRFERTSVETEILLFPPIVHRPHPGELKDPIAAFTIGTVRDVARARALAIGVGGDATWYGVPPLLAVTYGAHPVSFHVFVRIARANPSERMWNMTMADHVAGTDHEHMHHQ
jgi:hypothetical protein